ncbi:MAG: alkyl sulfatase dimerization domain-containing protein [Acidimicrobiales bacterium]
MAKIDKAVDRLIDDRPGAELLLPRYDDPAHPVADGIWRSGGTTAAYLIGADAGRVVVNTGMGFEAPHHRRVFDAVHPGPTPYIVTTQAHVDHVGGVGLFREPDTRYVAQAANPACQADDLRIQRFRFSTAMIWFGQLPEIIGRLAEESPGAPMDQDRPVPDILFDDRVELTVGDLELELISTPGGETRDACVVWLPQHRTALVSNLFGPLFPHFPNFNTLRGDRYRYAEPYLAAVETVRALQPEVLITGRHDPIVGADLIDASLARLHGAVDHVHRATLDGINAGKDVLTLMREIELPKELRVGQGYGRVPWAVRTFWESYVGWFRLQSSTELYPVDPREATVDLAGLLGADAVVDRAIEKLAAGEPVLALHLAEAALAGDADHAGAKAVARDAQQALLDRGDAENFWAGGWLRDRIAGLDA